MANSQKVKQRRIEKKYEKRIGKLIDDMSKQGKTMGELWIELDKLKIKMLEEFEKAGIELEYQ